MTSFKIGFRAGSARRMVEVFGDDGQFIGAIYPVEDGSNSIHLVSKYETSMEEAPPSRIPLPSKLIKFGPLIDGTGARQQEPSKE